MGDENRRNDPRSPQRDDRYRQLEDDDRFDRDERRYGAGDFEGSRYDRYDQPDYRARNWPPYEPGREGPEYRGRGGEEHAWERAATEQGYGPGQREGSRQRGSRDFGGWDAPFGGKPLHRHEEERNWERARHEGRSFLDRTREELATLFGAGRREDDYRYRGEGEYRGMGPRGYHRSDERIRDDIHDRLTDDSWLDASDIEVTVHDGEVTLDGQVRSRADKRRAEDVVEHVSGVGHVQNNLRADSDRIRRERQEMPPLI